MWILIQILLSIIYFVSPSSAHDLKILYAYTDNSKETTLPIYSDGQYNDLFLHDQQYLDSSYFSKLLFTNCQESSGLIVPPSENFSRIIVKNLERNLSFSFMVMTDLENHKLMDPTLYFSNENMLLPPSDKFELNMTFNCHSDLENNNPWSKVYFDMNFVPIENGTINENETSSYHFSMIKFCQAPHRSYWSLVFLMSTAVIVVYLSTKQPPIITDVDAPESQQIQPIHAFLFVIFGSIMLTILYFFLPYLVTLLFIMVIFSGLSSLTVFFSTIFEKYGSIRLNMYLGNIPYYGLIKAYEFLSLLIALTICILYVVSKNWILNNLIGVSFVFLLVRTIRMPNYFVALLMLGFAFFYDIFWVFYSSHIFGRSVMAYVATNLNLPMKIICPTLTSSPLSSCSLLGLGDMALPGFFIAFCYYFDKTKNIKIYHITSITSYIIALILCLFCLIVYNSAQPALLYISPCLLISVAYIGWRRGELKELWFGFIEEKKLPSTTQKKLERVMKDIRHKDQDECIEHDKEEHYYSHTDNTLIEKREEP